MAKSDEWVEIRNTITGGVSKVHKSSLSIWLEKDVIELVEDEDPPESGNESGLTDAYADSRSSTADDEAASVDDENSGE